MITTVILLKWIGALVQLLLPFVSYVVVSVLCSLCVSRVLGKLLALTWIAVLMKIRASLLLIVMRLTLLTFLGFR